MKYNRILLKLSGEALMGNKQYGIDTDRLNEYANEIKKVVDLGCEVAIVIGGGNIFRGLAGAAKGMDRVQGDYMGMLATVINGMALQGALEDVGINFWCRNWESLLHYRYSCNSKSYRNKC